MTWSPRQCVTMNITVTQTNPLSLALPHAVTNPIIKPVMQGNFLEEELLTTTIHDLLFKVTKNGSEPQSRLGRPTSRRFRSSSIQQSAKAMWI